MYMIAEVSQYVAVASFAEAWIEIAEQDKKASYNASPPSRRRGLKYNFDRDKSGGIPGRLLRGGVD